MAIRIKKDTSHRVSVKLFGRYLVRDMLSCRDFKVRKGTVIIAGQTHEFVRATRQQDKLAVTVSSRTRPKGKESASVRLSLETDAGLRAFRQQCVSDRFDPWIAVYVGTEAGGDLYMIPLDHYLSKYRRKSQQTPQWNMKPSDQQLYANDSNVKRLEIDITTHLWF
jgi:hypothetical protein